MKLSINKSHMKVDFKSNLVGQVLVTCFWKNNKGSVTLAELRKSLESQRGCATMEVACFDQQDAESTFERLSNKYTS